MPSNQPQPWSRRMAPAGGDSAQHIRNKDEVNVVRRIAGQGSALEHEVRQMEVDETDDHGQQEVAGPGRGDW